MHVNLIVLVKNQLSSGLLDKVSALLGESPDAINKGLLGSCAALLASFSEHFATESASHLFTTLGSGKRLDSLQQQLAGGNETVKFLSQGLDSAQLLLGDQADKVMHEVSQQSGLRPESGSSLLGIATPIVTGLLAKQKAAGMKVTDIAALLHAQKTSFGKLLPAGMSLQSIGIISQSPKTPAANNTQATNNVTTSNVTTNKAPSQQTINRHSEKSSTIEAAPHSVVDNPSSARKHTSILTWLLAAMFVIVAVLFLRSCTEANNLSDAMKHTKEQTNSAVEKNTELSNNIVNVSADDTVKNPSNNSSNDTLKTTANTLNETRTAKVEEFASMGKKIGQQFRFNLPGGVTVDVPEQGFEAELLASLAQGKAEYGKTYILNRISFETGAYTLTVESADQLKSIAALMTAYPELTANLRGHTDSTGKADGNLSLSLNRAKAVKNFLQDLKIEASRMTIVGKGSAEPIADNRIAEGRAINRRIDISFTQ